MWKTLEKRGIPHNELLRWGLDSQTITRLRNNKNVTIFTLETIAVNLHCPFDDIVETDYICTPKGKGKGSSFLIEMECEKQTDRGKKSDKE